MKILQKYYELQNWDFLQIPNLQKSYGFLQKYYGILQKIINLGPGPGPEAGCGGRDPGPGARSRPRAQAWGPNL